MRLKPQKSSPQADFLPQDVVVDGVRVPWFLAPFELHGETYDFCKKERGLYKLWSGQIKGRISEEEREQYHDQLSLLSPAFWIHEHLWIVSKSRDTVPLNRWTKGQRLVYYGFLVQWKQDLPVRLIVLKSRQVGATTIAGALLYWKDYWFDNQHILVIADLAENALNAFEMVVRYHDELGRTLPAGKVPVVKAKTQRKDHALLQYGEPTKTNRQAKKGEVDPQQGFVRNNKYRVGTASSSIRQHSKTHSGVHCTEVPYYPKPDELWLGLAQTVPNLPRTIIILEGTANSEKDASRIAAGAGWYEERWHKAESGDSSFIPIFVGWQDMPWVFDHENKRWRREYSTELPPQFRGKKGRENFAKTFDEAEIELLQRCPGLELEQLHWRRRMIVDQCNGDVKQFQQEYPSYAAEAFITIGKGVYDRDMVQYYVDQTNPLEPHNRPVWRGRFEMLNAEERDYDQFSVPDGWVKVYKWPEQGHRYVISGDPAEGWDEKADFNSGDVLDVDTFEQVAQVYCNGGMAVFAEQLACLIWIYGEGMCIPETNGLGQQLISDLKRLGVRNFYRRMVRDKAGSPLQQKDGFNSGQKTKQLLVGLVRRLGRAREFVLHDRVTANAIKHFVRLPNGSFGASHGKKDDAHSSLALALEAITSGQATAGRVTIGGQTFKRPSVRALVDQRRRELFGDEERSRRVKPSVAALVRQSVGRRFASSQLSRGES